MFDRDDWWQRDGAFRLLHDINPLRLRLAVEAAGGTLGGKRLLDIGCGGGIFAEAGAQAGARVVGCDLAEGAIAAAKKHAAQSGVDVEYRCQSSDTLQDSGVYDVVTCFEMLEHTDNPGVVVAAAAAALTPGGVAVFSTINRTPKAWGLVIVGMENIVQVLPHGTHDYEHFVKPEELAGFCHDCGLSVRQVIGMRYSFFGRAYFLDETALSVNYFMVAERPV